MANGFLEFGLFALVAFWYGVLIWAMVILSEVPASERERSKVRTNWIKPEKNKRTEAEAAVLVAALDQEESAA